MFISKTSIPSGRTALWARTLHLCAALALAATAHAAPDAAVAAAAAAQKTPLLETLKEFVSIETGSRDLEGIAQATDLLAAKLRGLGGEVSFVEPVEASTYRMVDTPEKIGRMVRAT